MILSALGRLRQSQPIPQAEAPDELEALTNASDHLRFAKQVLESAELPAELRQDLQQQIQRIEQRLADPSLYLAVIGEFSSGKSTFINALLQDELLATSALVATAAATHICHGEALQAELKLAGDRSGTVRTKPHSQNITLPWLNGIEGLDNHAFIQKVTTDEAIAQNIRQLTIQHPAPFLSSGITLIDTPGTNATQQHHAEITARVVEQQADAAIIIIPATQPLSQSISAFLDSNLRPYLHRCLFVVTRMDQVRKRDREPLLADIKARLTELLGIEAVQVYACAAQVVLDELDGDESAETSAANCIWLDQFQTLKGEIFSYLCQQKSIAIAENLIRLLNRLFDQLGGQLQSQWQDYQQRQTALESNIIPDLKAFTQQQQRQCQAQLDDLAPTTLSKLNHKVEKHRDKALKHIRKAIFDADDAEALQAAIDREASSILSAKLEALQESLHKPLNKLSDGAYEAIEDLDDAFEQAYDRLQALDWDLDLDEHNIVAPLDLSFDDVFDAAQSQQQSLNDQAGNAALGGGAAGAAIGTMLAPGIGTVIGGAIGLIFSAGIFGPSLDERKGQLWSKLEPELEAHFDAVKGELSQSAQAYVQALRCAIDERVEAYSATYSKTVQRLLKEQKRSLQELNQVQASLETELNEIDQRRQLLKDQQDRLALGQ